MTQSVEFVNVPDGQPAGKVHSANVVVETDRVRGTTRSVEMATVTAELFINGTSIGDLESESISGSDFDFEFVNRYADPGDYELFVEAEIDSVGPTETVTDATTITISESEEARRERREIEEEHGYERAYENRSSTLLTEIATEVDVTVPFDEVDFSPYDNPNISIDSSARFSVHEIIGGTTVRQKVGEDPTEITVSGVCTEDVATQVDQLRRVKLVTLLSDRVPNGVRCQVASTSTDPLDDGGAADMSDGDFLYEFNINLIEVDQPIQP